MTATDVTDVTGNIEALERARKNLVEWRSQTRSNLYKEIQQCERRLKQIDRDFDRRVLELDRQIRELTPPVEQKPQKPARPKRARISVEDGFTPEEVEHYYSLLRNGS